MQIAEIRDFPYKEVSKKDEEEKGRRGARGGRLIDAVVFYVHGTNGTDIDFYETRNEGERLGRGGGAARQVQGLGPPPHPWPAGQDRLWVSPGDTVPSL